MRLLAHISDLHFGRELPEVVDALVADIDAARPNVVVASGDFTQRARRSQYARAAEFLGRLNYPKILIPGNHDIPLFDVVRRFAAPVARYQRYITSDLLPFYRDEEIAILGLNTARPWSWTWNGFWKDGRISREQLNAVQKAMCSLPADLFKVVVTHHPFIPPPRERIHGMILGARKSLDIMQECGVDMLLAGHLHLGYSGDVRTHFEAIDRSILSIQAGTGVSTRRRNEPNAYNLIAIEPQHVTITVRAWNVDHFDEGEVTRYRRDDGFWQRE